MQAEFNALTDSKSRLIGFVVAEVPDLEVLCPLAAKKRLAIRARGLARKLKSHAKKRECQQFKALFSNCEHEKSRFKQGHKMVFLSTMPVLVRIGKILRPPLPLHSHDARNLRLSFLLRSSRLSFDTARRR